MGTLGKEGQQAMEGQPLTLLQMDTKTVTLSSTTTQAELLLFTTTALQDIDDLEELAETVKAALAATRVTRATEKI